MSHYIKNNEYQLRNITLVRSIMHYEMFPGEYPQVTIKLHIKRKPLYHSYTVIAPTLVRKPLLHCNSTYTGMESIPYCTYTGKEGTPTL